jgi:hypothetical protein
LLLLPFLFWTQNKPTASSISMSWLCAALVANDDTSNDSSVCFSWRVSTEDVAASRSAGGGGGGDNSGEVCKRASIGVPGARAWCWLAAEGAPGDAAKEVAAFVGGELVLSQEEPEESATNPGRRRRRPDPESSGEAAPRVVVDAAQVLGGTLRKLAEHAADSYSPAVVETHDEKNDDGEAFVDSSRSFDDDPQAVGERALEELFIGVAQLSSPSPPGRSSGDVIGENDALACVSVLARRAAVLAGKVRLRTAALRALAGAAPLLLPQSVEAQRDQGDGDKGSKLAPWLSTLSTLALDDSPGVSTAGAVEVRAAALEVCVTLVGLLPETVHGDSDARTLTWLLMCALGDRYDAPSAHARRAWSDDVLLRLLLPQVANLVRDAAAALRARDDTLADSAVIQAAQCLSGACHLVGMGRLSLTEPLADGNLTLLSELIRTLSTFPTKLVEALSQEDSAGLMSAGDWFPGFVRACAAALASTPRLELWKALSGLPDDDIAKQLSSVLALLQLANRALPVRPPATPESGSPLEMLLERLLPLTVDSKSGDVDLSSRAWDVVATVLEDNTAFSCLHLVSADLLLSLCFRSSAALGQAGAVELDARKKALECISVSSLRAADTLKGVSAVLEMVHSRELATDRRVRDEVRAENVGVLWWLVCELPQLRHPRVSPSAVLGALNGLFHSHILPLCARFADLESEPTSTKLAAQTLSPIFGNAHATRAATSRILGALVLKVLAPTHISTNGQFLFFASKTLCVYRDPAVLAALAPVFPKILAASGDASSAEQSRPWFEFLDTCLHDLEHCLHRIEKSDAQACVVSSWGGILFLQVVVILLWFGLTGSSLAAALTDNGRCLGRTRRSCAAVVHFEALALGDCGMPLALRGRSRLGICPGSRPPRRAEVCSVVHACRSGHVMAAHSEPARGSVAGSRGDLRHPLGWKRLRVRRAGSRRDAGSSGRCPRVLHRMGVER